MVTQFSLVDRDGKVMARGEIDGDIYRVFSETEFPGGYKEFGDTSEVLAAFVGCAMQPELFQSPAETRQLLLDK